MKLHFLGANRQVTGSRYCLEAAGRHILIDCGMFQERQFQGRNWEPSPVAPAEIADLLLTHVHIDHCGLIPRLVGQGYQGPIHATRPSVALAEVMLRDAARIQEEDAAYKKRRHEREGRHGRFPEVPLFTDEDVDLTLPLLRGVPYQKPVPLGDGITATFHDAGHILGSAMIELQVTEQGQQRSLLFSGDIGQWNKPLIRDPTIFERADYVIMESTYGDRQHETSDSVDSQLGDIIHDTVRRGGKVVIPTFAVERAQELMYHISQLAHDNRIPDIRVFLDSPMAVDVTAIFRKFPDCYDQETWQRIAAGESPWQFPGLTMARSVAESKRINDLREPCVIMATSGMCTAGRIKHHLRQTIGRADSTILFVGYQSAGTLGRQILDGQPEVRIHGQQHRVRARIAQIYGFSGHADRPALMHWLGSLRQAPRQVFLTHGDEDAARSLSQHIAQTLGWPVTVPHYQQVVELP